MYAPHRDAAYSYPRLIAAVLKHLDQEHWSNDVQQLVGFGLTPDAMSQVVAKLSDTFKLLIRHRPPVDWEQACEISGLDRTPWYARLALYSEFGVALLQYLPHALKEVSMVGEKSMAHDEYVDCLTAAVLAYRRLKKVEDPGEPTTEEQVERLLVEKMELERVIAQQKQELQMLRNRIASPPPQSELPTQE
jgi:hypothetical protein